MKIVIIGNGVAGVSVAETIRSGDKNCEIAVITDEKYPFYSRPRLIEFLANKSSIEQITIHAQGWYEKNAVQLERATRISCIDLAEKKLQSDNGKTFTYDKLVIAAGATSLVPPIPGIGSENVVTLRTIEDAERIKVLALKGKKAVVIGGGLLGIELAVSLQTLGMAVTIIELFDRLLPRQLDTESSEIIQRFLEQKGMAFLVGRKIGSIERTAGNVRVLCCDGKEAAADFVVLSTGIRPDCSLTEGTVIARNRGIVVDDCMRTAAPDVYACGDVAEHNGMLYGLWQPAREQGIVCGSHILGREAVYKGTVNSARLKVAGIELASIGDIEGGKETRTRTEKDDSAGTYKKLFVKDNRLVGAILIGNARESVKLQQMIRNREEFSGGV
jgi:nitrite reductase (NADH) large subunit